MLRRGFGAGDLLAAGVVVIGLTIVLLLTEAYLLVGFGSLCEEWKYRKAASEWGRKGDPKFAADLVREADIRGDEAKDSLKFGLTLAPLALIGIALASLPLLRSLMHRIGLRRSSARKATPESPYRALRIYLKLLMVSAILATTLHALIYIGLLVTND